MSAEATNIHRGLEGVVVDTTRISKVMPEINSLVYAGYPVQELCEHCSFEEVAWLMWHGELPTAKQLAATTPRMWTRGTRWPMRRATPPRS